MKNTRFLLPILIGALAITGISYAHGGGHFGGMKGMGGLSNYMGTGTTINFRIELTDEQKALMGEHFAIKEKLRNGETLTEAEQTTLDSMESTMGAMGHGMGYGMGHGMGMHRMNFMNEEDLAAFEAMTSEEKQAYIQSQMDTLNAKREAHEAVMDKILNGEVLTAEEEVIRQEIINNRNERRNRVN